MTRLRPHIEEILTSFFLRTLEGKTGLRRRRIETAETRLRTCLEQAGHRILVEGDAVLLAAEREFHPDDAFARTMHADDLIFALGIFVREPWLAEDRTDRRVQLHLTDALAGHVLGYNLIDRQQLMCELLDLRAGIDDAKRGLKRERIMSQAAISRSRR